MINTLKSTRLLTSSVSPSPSSLLPLSLSLREMAVLKVMCLFLYALMMHDAQKANGAFSAETQKMMDEANKNGPYVGLVIPNLFEMNPLLQSPSFTSSNFTIDFAGIISKKSQSYIVFPLSLCLLVFSSSHGCFQGRRFRFGTIAEKEVILVMTGLGMINAGITTQLLLSLFNIEGVVHYGTAGNLNPSLRIGDVTIPQYWSHTGLWNWQRYGQGPDDELALEEDGDYTREIGYLKFANYTANVTNCINYDNLLNNAWYQPEEIFPIDGTPEEREHIFWVPVDTRYFEISKRLEGLELERCLNETTCLSKTPKVATVLRGTSASIFVANIAYRSFIYGKFNVTALDMESASVALICHQQRVPFIAFRALSGGVSAESSDAAKFISLAAKNSVTVVVEFIKQLSANQALIKSFPPEE
ncbi:hypothetical protein L1049_018992 [Liquidambar formosana]|uniref:Nucleoside phosphorylase domain-containing protein n=1 Tax=Liquidambar formosana TaxID=63359 RepID=A0AAP0WN49_LIQFO